MSGVKKILVPTDFSEASATALRYACVIADALGASVHVLHTFENPYPIGTQTELYSLPADFYEQVENRARRMLDTVLTPEDKERYRATLVLRHGVAAQEILRYLREQGDVCLIVMGTHGRGGIARLMLGSVADEVMRAAPCPVLTIKGLDAQEPTMSRAA